MQTAAVEPIGGSLIRDHADRTTLRGPGDPRGGDHGASQLQADAWLLEEGIVSVGDDDRLFPDVGD